MITKLDIARVMTEVSQNKLNFDVWCERNNLDVDDLIGMMAIFGRELWREIAECEENSDGLGEAIQATVISHCVAFSAGFEVGRQFPVTPFNEQ